MDHKAVILLMLVCFLISEATPTASYSSWKPYSQTPGEDGLYDDGVTVYDHMASGLTSAQPHSHSREFVLSRRDMVEHDQVPSYMDDYNKRDVEALLTLKRAIKSDPYESLATWKAEDAGRVCLWAGISCTHEDPENVCPSNGMPCRQPTKRVDSIILPGLLLEGTLSASLGNLSFLSIFDLSNNYFTGRIPQELGRLVELVTLSLSANAFSGSIPIELGLLQKLEYLDLQSNKLENAIPSSLGNCSSLKSLLLGSNLLSSSIPRHLGNLRELTHLSIYSPRSSFYSPSSNNIGGNISGYIPPEIGNCSNLVVLDLGENIIHGLVPMSIFQLSLTVLDLGGNRLTLTIPEAIGNLSQLTRLHLNSNNITGRIPQAIANLSQLTHLFLDSNLLTGSIPKSITTLNKLEVLNLSENNLEGQIPEYICNCMKLTDLNMRSNLLSGRMPQNLHNCSALRRLTVSENSLSGDLEIGFPTSMEIISAHSNHFSGTLPVSLVNCSRLQVLDLKHNQLKGELLHLSNLDDFRVLSVGNNNLSGRIPQSMTNFTMLGVLDLSNNKFSGEIPLDLGKLQGFSIKGSSRLDVDILYVNIQIEMKGPEYTLAYILVTNTIFDLSNNNFEGEIPASMGSLQSLRFLNLSGNHLEGKIPESLIQISTLVLLDLSKNNLSGEIPQNLTTLYNMLLIDFSSNSLCGPIPSGIQSVTSFQNNKCLCGYPVSRCDGVHRVKESGNKSKNVNMWLIALGIVVENWLLLY